VYFVINKAENAKLRVDYEINILKIKLYKGNFVIKKAYFVICGVNFETTTFYS